MHRLYSLILAMLLAFSAIGCTKQQAASPPPPTGYTVPSPMKYPDYTFTEAPTTDMLRSMAIKGMYDLLSIQWHTEEEISYRKTGPVSGKHFVHLPENTYAGTIYTNASTGLFQFMEFYDQTTGCLSYTGTGRMKEAIGNSCADSLLWGWSTVCNSITGGFFPNTMVYKNGYIPVGNYTYDYTISTYTKLPTYKIIEDNGQDVILAAYTMVQPADALVSSSDNHAMMAIAAPHIEYTPSGQIDLQNSYITIQDQRGGNGTGFYDQIIDGHVYHYSGRTSFNFTFEDLLNKHYIPVTTAEFIGTDAYEKATVSIDKASCSNISDLLGAQVSSNYPLAVIRVIVTDKNNNESVIDRVLFSAAGSSGIPRSYSLKKINALTEFNDSQYNKAGNKLRLEVIVSTGERFTVAEFGV